MVIKETSLVDYEALVSYRRYFSALGEGVTSLLPVSLDHTRAPAHAGTFLGFISLSVFFFFLCQKLLHQTQLVEKTVWEKKKLNDFSLYSKLRYTD